MKTKALHIFLFISIFIIFILSGINPYDRFIWFLEVLPVIIGGIILIVTYPKFKFSNFVYIFLWIHALILIIGGHYTYAEMPLFNWIKHTFNLNRNYYDRLGHLAQGFIPALVIREFLIKKNILNNKKFLSFIVISICLSISASYEIIEFIVAILIGETAESFLGLQGDIWDAQWDMLLALIGSILALFLIKEKNNIKS
ncbi:DUF2238 domain-containing protein [Clostridium perfringens]|uniref:DUF2238 domain-containing protein n=1 Tax=Clostridium perfringens TaxID=1502 RepID=UPI0039ED9A42